VGSREGRGIGDAIVRVATNEDLEAVTRLYIALSRHHRALQPGNPRYLVGNDRWEAVARNALRDPATTVFVSERDGRVVGLLALSLVEKVWGTSCEIHTLMIDEAARGLGHGTALMGAAERFAAQVGARALRVEVLDGNEKGRLFYERLGYEPVAVRYGKGVPTS
jgi:ribosomal protein S18 acetylase RimI-like enzyme